MKRIIQTLFLLSLFVVPLPSVAQTLRVVASLPDLAAIARELGGKHVKVTALARPNQDPHYVDPRPSLILPLNKADLLIYNGFDLEAGWLPKLVQNARNSKILPGSLGHLEAASVISPKDVPKVKIDRSQGDIHSGGNPHFTYDPREVVKIAKALSERYQRLAPDKAKEFQANFETFANTLREIAATERSRFLKLPPEKRNIVVYHASLVYLRSWLGLNRVATIEPRPGVPPNPAHVAQVLQQMRKTKAPIILQEDYYARRASQTLAKLSEAQLVVIPGATHFHKGEMYTEHLKHITQAIYQALSK